MLILVQGAWSTFPVFGRLSLEAAPSSPETPQGALLEERRGLTSSYHLGPEDRDQRVPFPTERGVQPWA